jgi:hypothetical protein
MIRRLAWLLLAELAFANVVNAMWLLARWLVSRRGLGDPERALVWLRGCDDY